MAFRSIRNETKVVEEYCGAITEAAWRSGSSMLESGHQLDFLVYEYAYIIDHRYSKLQLASDLSERMSGSELRKL